MITLIFLISLGLFLFYKDATKESDKKIGKIAKKVMVISGFVLAIFVTLYILYLILYVCAGLLAMVI